MRAYGGRRLVTMPLDEPVLVVAFQEGEQREAQVFDGRQALHPEQLFLERTDEAFRAAVALGLTDEGGARDAYGS